MEVAKLFAGIFITVIPALSILGENKEVFNETYSFIKKLDISYLHVFSYSKRKNTK